MEITVALLGEVDRRQALQLVAERARHVAEAAMVVILLSDDGNPDELRVDVAAAGPDELVGASIPIAGTALATVLANIDHVIVDDLGTVAAWPAPLHTGPTLLASLAASGTVQGVLAVALPADSDGFEGDTDINMITTFAAQAALALERVRAQDERQQLIVLEDRERIARDLHDVVIQRLFATGLHLQSTAPLIVRDEVRKRVDQAVDDLDTTIRDIRRAIFELRTPTAASLHADLIATVTDAAGALGFRPDLRTKGPIDHAVPDTLRDDIVAVVREALSNVARHAKAGHATVDVTVDETAVTVRVTDNGIGPRDASDDPQAATRGRTITGHGLPNMRRRAADHGGTFRLTSVESGGTIVEWTAPLVG
jgi:signal transduction histidine kinase